MQALILAGGEGTRLRPLTSTIPKPVVPLADRPFATFMLQWLRSHGVDDVVLSCGFMAAGVRNVLGDGSALGIRLRYVEEPRPLGTGGAVKFAEPLLDERFVVVNGDVLTDFDLGAQVADHERSGARATLALIEVEDPSAYGLVRCERGGEVSEFVEKPSPDQAGADTISAGIYVLQRELLDSLQMGEPASIERDVFPALIGAGLHGHLADGYWLDIGTPQRYLQGTFDILEGAVSTAVSERLDGSFLALAGSVEVAGRVVPPALVSDGAVIARGAVAGSQVVVGRGGSLGERTHVERSVLLDGVTIGSDCRLRDCIVGAGARIGDRCRLQSAVLGEGVTLGAGNELAAGARLFPGVELPDGAIVFG